MSETFKKHWQAEIEKNQDLERQLEEVQKENTQLKEMREHLKGKDETRKEKERLERQLEDLLLGSRGARDLLNQSFVNYNEQLKENEM